jgi:hypothetical protein
LLLAYRLNPAHARNQILGYVLLLAASTCPGLNAENRVILHFLYSRGTVLL